MPHQPLRESDLIFPEASKSLSVTLTQLKRSNLSIKNRLKSIKQDAEFVCEVAETYSLPLVANERCGSWYIPPERKVGSAYFKSTDGHFGQWGFSLRRLNLQVLDVIGRYGGCVIVDSTRRGKSMPDALSKTIPIWVAVLNRLFFPEDQHSHELQSPLDVISESEHTQIQARLSSCALDVQSLSLDLDALRAKLNGKPMQVTWQRPDDQLSEEPYKSINLVVCCTASNQTSNTTAATSDYVQGAADDPEAWSLGLSAALFWRHQDELLGTNEDDLPALIEKLVNETRETSSIRPPTLMRPTCNIWVASNATAGSHHQDFDMVLSCSASPNTTLSETLKAKYVELSCGTGKNGSRQLRTELSKTTWVQEMLRPDSKVLVTCETGRDLSVGTALAILCLCYQDDGSLQHEPQRSINKTLIRQRLSWIMVSMPDASPSRATLQSVNCFLMG